MITDDEVIAMSNIEHKRKPLSDNPNTTRSRRRYAARLEWLKKRKSVPCADCGKEWPWFCMEFDHLEPDMKIRQQGLSKIGNIADAMRRLSLRAFMEEVDKCDVVCVICHRLREFGRGMYGNR